MGFLKDFFGDSHANAYEEGFDQGKAGDSIAVNRWPDFENTNPDRQEGYRDGVAAQDLAETIKDALRSDD